MAISTDICTIEDIRRTCGIESSEIEDDDVSRLITEGVEITENYLNTAIQPRLIIESLDGQLGSENNIIFTKKMPILRLEQVKVDTTTVSPQYVKIYSGGKLVLTDDAEETEWDTSELQSNIIKYYYGLLEESRTDTTTSEAITTPTANDILKVTSTNGMKVGQWVRIQGMDGYNEVTQIEAVSTVNSTITVDLYYPHENDSIVTIMQYPYRIRRFVEIIVSLMMVARIVGASYKDVVGYGIEEFNVQKGEPYTQWRETYNQLNNERLELKKSIRPMPSMA